MSDTVVAPADSSDGLRQVDRTALLRRFVEAYWLRPENAFWMTLRSLVLSEVSLETPSMDVACGDGVFTFLHAGGALDPDFDVFRSVGALDRVTLEHADMFDHGAEGYAANVIAHPDRRITVGLDAKPALLAKARCLALYDDLVEHDANRPLPFEARSFRTVYCNAAYWIENIDGFLGELRRIVGPDGRVVLQVKLSSMRQYNLACFQTDLSDRVLDIIGRGRLECWSSLTDRRTWESRFANAGLEVVACTPFVTSSHARIWDVGLRPIAPLLIRMANAVTPETRSAIKRDWVELFCDLLEPICRFDFQPGLSADEPAEIQYVLVPSF